jgi:HSP20 family protein
MRHVSVAEPHQDFLHLARHMSGLMHKIIQSGFSPGEKSPDWAPAVDICEMPDSYEVIVELAGVKHDEIEVYTQHHQLTIAGWRGDPTPRTKVCVHQMEIEQGQFCRRLRLPGDADDESISAQFHDGLLFISIAKRPGV